MRPWLLGLLPTLFFFSCHRFEPPELSFYHWKGRMAFDRADSLMAAGMGVSDLHVRFFDVDWDTGRRAAVPLSVVSGKGEDFCHGGPIVPVVFLTNDCFLNLDSTGSADLAEKVADGIRKVRESRFGDSPAFAEWQIDCDWTPKSRDRFFVFLEKLKTLADGAEITCTVRLHQYRDRSTNGIPPVARGLLMCYNVAEATDEKARNSVFDPEIVRAYLDAPPYPVPLDIALPIFSWGALFRDHRFAGLLNPLPRDTSLLAPEEGFWHRVKRDTVIEGLLLRKGDRLRGDFATVEDLEQVAVFLRKKKNLGAKKIIFYHWDKNLIRFNESSEIVRIYRLFL
jgi:hypothetical protein